MRNNNGIRLIVQRIIGIVLIITPVWLLQNGWLYNENIQSNDGTLLFILFPIGLFLIISNTDIIKYIKEYDYEEGA